MTHDELRDLCAAYALGSIDDHARASFEHHLRAGCDECAAAVEGYRRSAGLLAHAATPAAPSMRLRRRLLSNVGDDKGFYFLRAGEGEWEHPHAGMRLRRLFIHPLDGRETRWLELAAGTHDLDTLLPPASGMFVTRGSLAVDGEPLAGGDWRRLGSAPARRATVQETTSLVVYESGRPADDVAPARTVRQDQGRWRDFGQGTFARVLEVDRVTRGSVLEVRMNPRGVLGPHRHGGDEEVLMLIGDCQAMQREFEPDDYHRARRGTVHDGATTRGGCRMLNLIDGPLEAL